MLSVWNFILTKIVSKINWVSLKYAITGREYNLKDPDIRVVAEMLSSGRYIGLTRRDAHLSTYLISLGHFFMTLIYPVFGKKCHFGHWSHAFIHTEKDGSKLGSFHILEAIGSGVTTSEFWSVLNCDSVVLLSPKYLDEGEFESMIDYAESLVGTPYDTEFKLFDKSKVSCVEYIYHAMLSSDKNSLPKLSYWVERTGNLTPDMIYECGDFDIAYEVRR